MSRQNNDENIATVSQKRRDVMLSSFGLLSSAAVLWTSPIEAFAANMPGVQDTVNIDQFLRTGVDGGGNMGVSSQAGKSRPETGVILRDGADVFRDKGTGDVLAEILIGTKLEPVAIVASFRSPWPLATGSVFDVECRDAKTGDGTFMAVTDNVGGKSLEELPSDFFMERLFNPVSLNLLLLSRFFLGKISYFTKDSVIFFSSYSRSPTTPQLVHLRTTSGHVFV